jgi:hypothetical protein
MSRASVQPPPWPVVMDLDAMRGEMTTVSSMAPARNAAAVAVLK